MSDTGIVRTAFDEVQQKMGVELMDWEGWYWPNHFGDAVAEHNTVREHVGVWDESPLRKWDFNGPDALAAADRIFTNDMLGLEIGQVRYAPFCDENGNMVGDGTVFKFTDTSCWVDHRARLRLRPLPERRRRDAGRDRADHREAPPPADPGAQVARAPRRPHGRVRRGPRLLPLLPAPGPRRGASRSGSRAPATRASSATRSSRDPDYAEELWEAVTGAGAKPYGLAAVETLRIESGLIFIGYDYFQHETNPYDMSLDKVIRLDTGDFEGKAALAETAKSPPRRLVTLEVQGDEVPEYGAAVTRDGEPAGTLTSPCESPTLGKVIGMAVLETAQAEKGNQVEVALSDGGVANATVADFPIYDPEKKRPRS